MSEEVFALDLGSSKICLARLSNISGHNQVDLIESISEGVEGGVLSDFKKLSLSIFELISQFEDRFSCQIKRIHVGLTGHHLDIEETDVQLKMSGKILTQEKLDFWQTSVRTSMSDEQKYVLFNWMSGYCIDGRDEVINPIGLSGDVITAKSGAIRCTRSYAKDIIRACNEAGVQVASLLPESLASALVTTTKDERELGVASVDIGHGSMDGIVFYDGFPAKLFMVSLGGRVFNSEIMKKFILSKSESEKMKVFFGMEHSGSQQKPISVMNLYNEPIEMKSELIRPVLKQTSRQLCEGVFKNLLSVKKKIPYGIVLSGGTSQLKGISKHWSDLLSIKVQARNPEFLEKSNYFDLNEEKELWNSVGNLNEYSAQARFSTILGLLYIARSQTLKVSDGDILSRKVSFPKKLVAGFLGWLKEIQD